jgi:UDP-2,4-diacetamido-2,4,6-trideoxy-beta-L-altropyranose hydrolase
MNLGFYVNASEKIGYGHWYRCINIAEILNIKKIYFFSHQYLSIKNKNIQLIKIRNNDLSLSRALIKKKINTLLIDDYNFSTSRQKNIRNNIKKIIVIDDSFNKRYLCDLIINYSFSKQKNIQDLKKKNFGTWLALGKDFLPLNNAIVRIKKKAKIRNELNKILIFFGGSSQKKLSRKMLEIITHFKEIFFYIVGDKEDLKELQNEKRANTKFFSNIENNELCKIMVKSDLAIGSGGFNLYERVFLGLPAITILLKNNQINNINYAESKKLILNLGSVRSFKIQDLIYMIKLMKNKKGFLKKISQNCLKEYKNYNNLKLKNIILNSNFHNSSSKK